MTKLHIASRFPVSLGNFTLEAPEVMYYLYYPVKRPGEFLSSSDLPRNLCWINPLINSVYKSVPELEYLNRYLYVTVKNMYVEPGSYGNRPGWHIAGFGTDDVNFVWCNSSPTEVCIQDFEVSEDDKQSLEDFEIQAKPENIVSVEVNHFYIIDSTNVHREALNSTGGNRTFVKLSLSKHKFNLKGNSISPISKNWKFYSRSELRNMESISDFK